MSGYVLLVLAFLLQDSEVETVADGGTTIVTALREPPEVRRHDEGMPARHIEIEDGVELYVIEEGEGVPVVLLNGGPGNSLLSFIPHFSRAASFARVVYYDPRGVGESSWEPGPAGYSTPQALADLERLRERLGIDGWVVLGWSWGGLLAQRYLIEHPERVRGLVLVASSESMGLEKDDDTFLEHRSPAELIRLRELYVRSTSRIVPLHSDDVDLATVRQLVFTAFLNGDWKRQYFFKPSIERMAHIARHEWLHDKNYNRLLRETGSDIDLTGVFADLPLPVLMVYGAWDMSFSREMPGRLREQFSEAQLFVLERSSHNPFASEPEVFFGLLRDYLGGLSNQDPSARAAWGERARARIAE